MCYLTSCVCKLYINFTLVPWSQCAIVFHCIVCTGTCNYNYIYFFFSLHSINYIIILSYIDCQWLVVQAYSPLLGLSMQSCNAIATANDISGAWWYYHSIVDSAEWAMHLQEGHHTFKLTPWGKRKGKTDWHIESSCGIVNSAARTLKTVPDWLTLYCRAVYIYISANEL